MTELTKDDIIKVLDELGNFISDNDVALFLNKNRFGIKVHSRVKKYADNLDKEQPGTSNLFEVFLGGINSGIDYVININQNADRQDIATEIKREGNKNKEVSHSDDDQDEYVAFDLESYGNYKGISFREYVYNQLSNYILLIIDNSYGDLEEAMKLIEKENYILDSLEYEFKTYRDLNNIKKIDMYAARLIFGVESLKTEKFEFEVTYDQLNIMIKQLSEIKEEFDNLKN